LATRLCLLLFCKGTKKIEQAKRKEMFLFSLVGDFFVSLQTNKK